MASVTVMLSGAAGQISYSLLPLICNGSMFGPNTRVNLRMRHLHLGLQLGLALTNCVAICRKCRGILAESCADPVTQLLPPRLAAH